MAEPQNGTQLSFDPTCPSGGTWQVCGSTFLGCCAGDACTSVGCSEGRLYPVAFDSTQYSKFPDATCGNGIKFYTCGFGPTFWGCCKSNPCNAGAICPDGDLAPANIGNPVQEAYYLGEDSGVSSVTSVLASATSTSTYTPGTLVTSIASLTSLDGAISTPTTTAVAPTPPPASHTAAIAGGSAGGGVVVALLVCWLVYYVCYVRRSRQKHNDELERRQSDLAIATVTEKPNKMAGTALGGYDSAPPGYSSPNSSAYPYQQDREDGYAYAHTAASSAAWKPQHRHGMSELSGETVWRGELESPLPSPRVGSAPQSPRLIFGDEANWSGHGNASELEDTRAREMRDASGDVIVEAGERRTET